MKIFPEIGLSDLLPGPAGWSSGPGFRACVITLWYSFALILRASVLHFSMFSIFLSRFFVTSLSYKVNRNFCGKIIYL